MKIFKPNKTIKELGIDVSRKFVVVKKGNFNIGDILTLDEDDNTDYPYFRNQDNKRAFIFLNDIAYYEEETKEETKQESKYAVFLVGKSSPTKLNHTLESAVKEAKRLCEKENKKAYVVRLVGVQEPKVVADFISL